jgi:RNA polymerase sigma-70 factor, ECF subfamily
MCLIGAAGDLMTLMGEIEASIPALRRYAWSLLRNTDDADDLVQDCLVRALDQVAMNPAITAVRPWLFMIMHNVFVSRWRTARRRRAMMQGDAAGIAGVSVGTEQDGALARRDLLAGLDQLSEDQRRVLLLTSVEGLEYREVASVLGIPVGTVMSRLSRARDNLYAHMDGGKQPLLRRVK